MLNSWNKKNIWLMKNIFNNIFCVLVITDLTNMVDINQKFLSQNLSLILYTVQKERNLNQLLP